MVSIVIPCHNAALWLAQTLESALAQTHPDIEIIVVDDGSTDDSLVVARTFESRGVHVVSQPNRGASAARNHGLRLARGEFIQFLDADDLLAPDKIAAQVATLTRTPAIALSASQWGRFTDSPAQAVFNAEAVYQARNGTEFLQLHYETGSMMQPGAWLTSRALLDRAGPWDETLSLNDDGEYFSRVMLAASQIVFTPTARCYYRAPAHRSLSRRRDAAALASLFRSVELTTGHLLAADRSPRSQAAAAHGWKWTAFELYPGAPALSRAAERKSAELGGSPRPFPAGPRFQFAARLLGWRLAKRIADCSLLRNLMASPNRVAR